MVEQVVKRVTLTGSVKIVEFVNSSPKYLIKNFSEGDIYVSFYAPFTNNEAIKIASKFGQEVVANERFNPATNVIYINGTGEVEVQQLWI